MKLLILCHKVPYPAYDGSSIAMQSMAEAYRQNEQSVDLIALNTDKHYQSAEAIEKSCPQDLNMTALSVSTRPRISSALTNLWGSTPYQLSRFRQAKMEEALKDYFQHNSCDFIQLEGLSMVEYLPLLRKLSSAPLILRAHNIEHHIWERHLRHEKNILLKRYLRLQNRRLKVYEQKAFSEVDGLLFISDEDRKAYQNLKLGSPSITIACGISSADLPSYPPPDYGISYLASFDWLPNRQGMEWFVEKVWPTLRRNLPDLRLLLAGRHIPQRYYQWKRQGIDVVGEVADPRASIRRGKITVVPLLAGSGMRIKLLENLALGQPMVVTPQAAEGLPVEHQHHLLLAQDPEAMAQQCLELLGNSQRAAELGQNARAFALQNYQHRSLGEKALNFIADL